MFCVYCTSFFKQDNEQVDIGIVIYKGIMLSNLAVIQGGLASLIRRGREEHSNECERTLEPGRVAEYTA